MFALVRCDNLLMLVLKFDTHICSYLTVTWTSPTDRESGKYICEVTAVDKAGRGVGFKTSRKIDATPMSISDLVFRVYNDYWAYIFNSIISHLNHSLNRRI